MKVIKILFIILCVFILVKIILSAAFGIKGYNQLGIIVSSRFESPMARITVNDKVDIEEMRLKIGNETSSENDSYIWNNYKLIGDYYGILEMTFPGTVKWSWQMKNYSKESSKKMLDKLSKQCEIKDISSKWNEQNNDSKDYYAIIYKGNELFCIDSGTDLVISFDPNISVVNLSN